MGKYILAYFLIINIAAYIIMGIDKKRSKNSKWRIPERELFTLFLLGGSIGGLLGMNVFKHKTKHWYFKWGLPIIILVQLLIAVFMINNY
jgi:uncharacterized membrane protein YsdA (DUF1294 family)